MVEYVWQKGLPFLELRKTYEKHKSSNQNLDLYVLIIMRLKCPWTRRLNIYFVAHLTMHQYICWHKIVCANLHTLIIEFRSFLKRTAQLLSTMIKITTVNHGLQMPYDAFFHWNPELLGLGRQIGQVNSETFRVFSVKICISTHFGTVSPLSMFSIMYSTYISTKN